MGLQRNGLNRATKLKTGELMTGYLLLFSTFYILIACFNEFYVYNDLIVSLSTESRLYFLELYILFFFSLCRTIASRLDVNNSLCMFVSLPLDSEYFADKH